MKTTVQWSTVPKLRQAHAVSMSAGGLIVPEARLSSRETAELELRGYEIVRQDLSQWGEFATLAKSGDRYYLLALA